jgi:hypothetical protein
LLLPAHSAPMQIAFYRGTQFPETHRQGASRCTAPGTVYPRAAFPPACSSRLQHRRFRIVVQPTRGQRS